MQNILEVRDLQVTFGTKRGTVQPVRGVSFEVRQGETLGIVGESGCGKSVTSLAVMGLLPKGVGKICGGSVNFRGTDLAGLGERGLRTLRGNKISMIFQEPMTSLNPVFTIGDQLSQPLRQHTKMSGREIHDRMVEMLRLVGIPREEEILRQYPFQLSGGMRQRVMICLAIICGPDLLIADEPTTALDVTIQAQILDLLKSIIKKTKMSMIFITHDLGVVAEICDRVAVMYAGQIVEQADVRAFFDRPAHPYSRGLLASLPKEDERKRELYAIKGNVPALNELPNGCAFSNRCPDAFARCEQEMPPLFQTGDRLCRCWLCAEAREGESNG